MSDNTDNKTAASLVTFVKFMKLDIVTEYVDAGGKTDTARFTWGVSAGWPRATMYTKKDDFSIQTQRYAPMDYMSIGVFIRNCLLSIENATRNKTPINCEVACYTTKVVDNKRTDTKILAGVLTFKEDESGLPYLTIAREKATDIRFYIPVSTFLEFRINGAIVTDARELALANARVYFQLLDTVYKDRFVADATRITTMPKKENTNYNKTPVKQNTAENDAGSQKEYTADDLPF